jgi:ABC-type sugar transport system permease subunit
MNSFYLKIIISGFQSGILFFIQRLEFRLCIAGSLLLAVLVNNAVKGVKIFRTIYFIPSIVTGSSAFCFMVMDAKSSVWINQFFPGLFRNSGPIMAA